MNFPVLPELPIASIVCAIATAAMGYSAPSVIHPQSTYKSGKVVQTNGATSLPNPVPGQAFAKNTDLAILFLESIPTPYPG